MQGGQLRRTSHLVATPRSLQKQLAVRPQALNCVLAQSTNKGPSLLLESLNHVGSISHKHT